MDSVAGNVYAGNLVDNFLDLGNDEAALETGRFDNGRRVFGVRAGVKISVAICADGSDESNVGRQVDEIAREKLKIGVYSTELYLPAEEQSGNTRGLRSRVREIEPLCYSLS